MDKKNLRISALTVLNYELPDGKVFSHNGKNLFDCVATTIITYKGYIFNILKQICRK